MIEESLLTCDEIWVDVLLLGKQVHPSQLLAKKASSFSYCCSCSTMVESTCDEVDAHTCTQARVSTVSSSVETVVVQLVRQYVVCTYATCALPRVGMSMYDETIVRPYVRSYLFHMHVRATTRRLYVRALRKSSRHSSPLQAPHKNFHHHHRTHRRKSFIFLEFSFPINCIFLFSTIANTIFPEIVFNLPSNVSQLSIAFSFSISSFSFSNGLNTTITLTITLEN